MKSEPILIICGAIGGVITAAITVLVAFGVHVSAGQSATLVGFVAVVTQLVAALYGRTQVTPVAASPKPADQTGAVTLRLVLAVIAAALAVWVLLIAAGSKVAILLAVAVIALAAAVAA